MATWPSGLPAPSVEGYAIRPVDPVLRTRFEAGNSRARRRSATADSLISVSWLFSAAEMAVFEAWHDSEIAAGASSFSIDLANGLGMDTHTATFDTMWDALSIGPDTWRVSATLRVGSRPVLTAEQLEVALAYAADDITYGSSALHTLIHSTLPGYW